MQRTLMIVLLAVAVAVFGWVITSNAKKTSERRETQAFIDSLLKERARDSAAGIDVSPRQPKPSPADTGMNGALRDSTR